MTGDPHEDKAVEEARSTTPKTDPDLDQKINEAVREGNYDSAKRKKAPGTA
jgi:hypothetical protein